MDCEVREDIYSDKRTIIVSVSRKQMKFLFPLFILCLRIISLSMLLCAFSIPTEFKANLYDYACSAAFVVCVMLALVMLSRWLLSVSSIVRIACLLMAQNIFLRVYLQTFENVSLLLDTCLQMLGMNTLICKAYFLTCINLGNFLPTAAIINDLDRNAGSKNHSSESEKTEKEFDPQDSGNG